MFVIRRFLSIAMIVLTFPMMAEDEAKAAFSLTLMEEQAFNASGGPFSAGLVLAGVSNPSTGPGTITLGANQFATVTDTTISQYENAQFASIPFNGIIIYSAATDPIFTSVTLTGVSAFYGNPFYPGPFTSGDVSFNNHEIALNYAGISLTGTVSLSFTTAASVPEPTSLVLSGIAGLAGLAVASFRRRRLSH